MLLGREPIPGYFLKDRLGAGRIGEVWSAVGPGGTHVALKFVRLGGKPGLKEYRAIQRIKQLRHPNLTPIFVCWLLDSSGKVIGEGALDHPASDRRDTAFLEQALLAMGDTRPDMLVIAMLLGDMSLSTRLVQCQQDGLPGIPPEELLAYMQEAAKALDFLNRSEHGVEDDPGMVQHCDIKPHNLLLVGDSAQVCDFGLAVALEDDRTTAAISATPAYGAPELFTGNAPSPHTDQYSLAITYYELRTGELPLAADDQRSIMAVMEAHRTGRLDLGLVDGDEQRVLRRAMSLDPNQRYGSVMAFVKKLESALNRDEKLPQDHSDILRATLERAPSPKHSGDPAPSRLHRQTRPGGESDTVIGSATPANVAIADTLDISSRRGDDAPPGVLNPANTKPTPLRRSYLTRLIAAGCVAALLAILGSMLRANPSERLRQAKVALGDGQLELARSQFARAVAAEPSWASSPSPLELHGQKPHQSDFKGSATLPGGQFLFADERSISLWAAEEWDLPRQRFFTDFDGAIVTGLAANQFGPVTSNYGSLIEWRQSESRARFRRSLEWSRPDLDYFGVDAMHDGSWIAAIEGIDGEALRLLYRDTLDAAPRSIRVTFEGVPRIEAVRLCTLDQREFALCHSDRRLMLLPLDIVLAKNGDEMAVRPGIDCPTIAVASGRSEPPASAELADEMEYITCFAVDPQFRFVLLGLESSGVAMVRLESEGGRMSFSPSGPRKLEITPTDDDSRGSVEQLIFDREGQQFLEVGDFGKLLLWRVPEGDSGLLPHPAHLLNSSSQDITVAAFSDTGRHVLAGDRHGVVHLWRCNAADSAPCEPLASSGLHQAGSGAIGVISVTKGDHCALIGRNDGSLFAWDILHVELASGQPTD